MFDNDGPWENTTINESTDESGIFGADPSESVEAENENGLCDCDPEHKESQTVQRSAGATIGGFGGQVGDGTTVIICTNCGGRFYEDEDGNGRENGFNPGM